MFFAAISAILFLASVVADAVCGVIIMFFSFFSCGVIFGSFSNTSIAAAFIVLFLSAVASAFSFIIGPLDVLISVAVFFICLSCCVFIRCFVVGSSGVCIDMKSDVCSSFFSGWYFMFSFFSSFLFLFLS